MQTTEASHGQDTATLLARSVDGIDSCLASRSPIVHHQGDTGTQAASHGITDVRDVLACLALEQRQCMFIHVRHDLLVHLTHRRTRITLRAGLRRLGVDRTARLVLVAVVGAGKRLCQHEVRISADGVCLADDVGHVVGIARHCLLTVDDVVGIGNPRVVTVPHVVRTPGRALKAAFHLIQAVEPEPAAALRSLNHVLAHHVGHQVVRTDAETLVLVGLGRPSSIHRAVYTVQGDNGRAGTSQQGITGHRIGRRCLECTVQTRRQRGTAHQRGKHIVEYLFHICSFSVS